jgi:hypothetical protein
MFNKLQGFECSYTDAEEDDREYARIQIRTPISNNSTRLTFYYIFFIIFLFLI